MIAGVIGQQLSTISQQFFVLYSLFIGQQLSTISQQFFFSTLFLLDNNYPQLTNNFWFSTLFLLDNNYPQLTNNFFSLLPFLGQQLSTISQHFFSFFSFLVYALALGGVGDAVALYKQETVTEVLAGGGVGRGGGGIVLQVHVIHSFLFIACYL